MIRACLLVTLMLAVLAPGVAGPAHAAPDAARLCRVAAAAAERIERLPRFLLRAVALAESGRWDDRRAASFAWPWTVNNAGDARYLPSRDAALAEVRRLQARGARNIDVGCMQINLMHHGDAFASLEEAIDPIHNVAYAARFLKTLRREAGAWAHAVGRYHSARWKARGRAYWRRVHALWIGEQKRDFRRRRAARLQGAGSGPARRGDRGP